MIHVEVERQIAELHKSGRLDRTVVDLLVPNGTLHDFEGFQFDYKDFTRDGSGTEVDAQITDLVRDFASFYNSMGGYIILTYKRDRPHEIVASIRDNDKLNQIVSGYVATNIGIRTWTTDILLNSENTGCVLVYIPKRPVNEKPRAFVKNSKNLGTSDKQRFIIKKGDIYCRFEHECRSAHEDVEILTYLFSEREPSALTFLSAKIENNLPPKDPNLLQFVGRKEYLESLWRWLSEPRRPIKVLTAAGGLGKTTIAYEFATQVLERPGAGFEKVVWLSGKKITFASLLGKLVSTTRCDFENVDELLDNLLLQIGTPREAIELTDDLDDKIVLCIEAFATLSILLIVDDVDSLPRDEQNDLYAAISQIVVSANVSNDNSRVLFTSRLELLTGREQRIAMRGFDQTDFSEYLDVNIDYLIEDEKQARRVRENKPRIYDASAGSPIFITSIVRLVSLGHDLSRAVADWRGKNGEQIRAFAFEREIDQLTAPQKEILYAMQLLSRARVDEVKDICGLTSIEIEAALTALKEYHLYATKGDPTAGTVLEVPEPIRLMHDVTRSKLPDDRRRHIERLCLKAKSDNDDPARHVALVISQTVRHWKSEEYVVAESYLTDQIQKNEKIGEFYCMRGRTRLNIEARKNEQIEGDFEQAEKYGCNQFDLIKFWYILKLRSRDWRGIYQLHRRRATIAESFPIFNCCHVMAAIRIADHALQRKPQDARDYYYYAIETAFRYISSGKGIGYFYQLRRLISEAAGGYINAISIEEEEAHRSLSIFRFVAKCLDFNFAPTYFLRYGLRNLDRWLRAEAASSELRRQRSSIVDDLDKVSSYLNSQPRVRAELVAECARMRVAI